jgi:prolyl 4-hydroxylase
MSAPQAELHRWIQSELDRGQSDLQIFRALEVKGWKPQQIQEAIASARGLSSPRPPEAEGGAELLIRLDHPPVALLSAFLSPEDCAELMAEAEPRMKVSEVVVEQGKTVPHDERRSTSCYFPAGSTPLLQRLEARVSALIGWPVDRFEPIQVLRYAVGGEYKPHYDYFAPGALGSENIRNAGGQRVGTLIMYLNTPEGGGATVFPDLGLHIPARAGQALFFSYVPATPASRSLHGGEPVTAGEKWIATFWLRERSPSR